MPPRVLSSNKPRGWAARLAAFALAAVSASADPATASETTGVPACDAYLKEYEQCIVSRVPEAQKAEMLKNNELARIQYRRMNTMRYKPDMVALCQDTRAQLMPFLTRTYGCRFD